MRILFIIFLANLILSCATITGNNDSVKKDFEGIIVYKVVAESRTKNISTGNLQRLYGDTMVMSIKKGKYKMSYSGLNVKDILYFSEDNNEYTLFYNTDTLYVSSCANDPRPLMNFEVFEEEELILGRRCNKILINLGSVNDDTSLAAQNTYWYDPEIYLDPAHYKDRKISHVNLYYEKAQSPWLKYMFEGSAFNLSYTAISIEKKSLRENIFKLPEFPRQKYP